MKSRMENVKFPFKGIVWTDNTQTHFVGRCPFCGDSQSHKHKGHLYVSKTKPVFMCQRCSFSGNISQIEELLNEKCEYEYSKGFNLNYSNVNVKELLNNSKSKNSFLINDMELNYISERCNFNGNKEIVMKLFNVLSEQEAFRMFPDLKNNKYSSDRIWFKTIFGTTITGRAMFDNPLRYIKMNAKENEISSSDFLVDSYVISNSTIENLNNSIPETLIIAEGIFDIISIFMNYKKYNLSKNLIYSACMGSFYSRSEKTFQCLFSSKPKNIEIFADKGIAIEKLKEQFKDKLPYQKIKVHYPMVKDWNPAGPIRMSFNI